MDKNIYLIGFMGAGKSTVASALSELTRSPVLEMDEVIAKRAGMSIPEIFRTKGEDAFRQMETGLLRELSLKGASHAHRHFSVHDLNDCTCSLPHRIIFWSQDTAGMDYTGL